MKIKARRPFIWHEWFDGDGSLEIRTKDGREVEIAGAAAGGVLGCIKPSPSPFAWTLDGRCYKDMEHGECVSDLYFEEEIEVDPREMAVEIAERVLKEAESGVSSRLSGFNDRMGELTVIARGVEQWLKDKGICQE